MFIPHKIENNFVDVVVVDKYLLVEMIEIGFSY